MRSKRQDSWREPGISIPLLLSFSARSVWRLAVNETGTYGMQAKYEPYRPWLSGHLMPKRHVQNDRERSLLSDQSVVLPPINILLTDLRLEFYPFRH